MTHKRTDFKDFHNVLSDVCCSRTYNRSSDEVSESFSLFVGRLVVNRRGKITKFRRRRRAVLSTRSTSNARSVTAMFAGTPRRRRRRRPDRFITHPYFIASLTCKHIGVKGFVVSNAARRRRPDALRWWHSACYKSSSSLINNSRMRRRRRDKRRSTLASISYPHRWWPLWQIYRRIYAFFAPNPPVCLLSALGSLVLTGVVYLFTRQIYTTQLWIFI